jgi:hypothetical protein
VGNTNRGVSIEMGEYGYGEGALIDHNVIMNNHPDQQLDIMDASGCLVVNNLIAGDKRGALVTQMYGGDTRRSDNNAFYNNIFCNHTEANISAPYPIARAGEQRFLGNLYDATTRKMHINNYTDQWQTSPLSDFQFYSRVASDAGTSVAALTTAGALSTKLVKLNLEEWQSFWAIHTNTEHYDSDAQVMAGLTAEYMPATQSVKLYLPTAVTKRLNSRWDANYKNSYGLTETESYPGPFDGLQAGNNVFQLFTEPLPILQRGKLPGPEEAEEPDMPYGEYLEPPTPPISVEVAPIRIYPNPVHDILTIEHAENWHLAVYSDTGQKKYEKNQLQDKESFSVVDWLQGVYFINLQSPKSSNAGEISIRIIKE